jgi:hypothetical protein
VTLRFGDRLGGVGAYSSPRQSRLICQCGHVQWQERDGAVVTFFSLLAQLEIVTAAD